MSLIENWAISKNFVYYNFPKRSDFETYTQVISQYINYLMQFEAVESIYQAGKISAPGISDIDLFIVIRDDTNSKELAKINFFQPLKEDYSLFLHPPFIMNETTFLRLNALYPHMTLFLTKLAGKKLQLVAEKNQKEFDTLNFIDLCTLLYSKDFLPDILVKKIDVRYTLCRLSSLKYSLRVYNKITKQSNKSRRPFIKEMIHLKEKWFENEDTSLLKEYLIEAARFNQTLIFDFSQYLKTEFNLTTESWIYTNPYYYTFFLKNISVCDIESKVVQILEKIGLITAILPSNLGYPLQFYATQKGLLNRHLSHYTVPEVPQQTFNDNNLLLDPMQERYILLNKYLSFLSQNCLQFGYPLNFYGFRFYFGLRSNLYDKYIFLKSKYFYYKTRQILKE